MLTHSIVIYFFDETPDIMNVVHIHHLFDSNKDNYWEAHTLTGEVIHFDMNNVMGMYVYGKREKKEK